MLGWSRCSLRNLATSDEGFVLMTFLRVKRRVRSNLSASVQISMRFYFYFYS
jgi:hypothetical protein